ncbi:MAG: pyridoxal-phosphate dependent enzyme, partial [Nitrospinota bacterium]
FDDPWIIEGQGTIGLEILEEWPDLDTVIVPLSGGGLIAGIGLALKTINPCIQVIGVSQERSPVMYHSLQAGHPVTLPDQETLADALVGGIDLANRYTFSLVQRYVDQVYLVSEAEIAQAIRFLLATHHLVVEGGGAVGVAALLASKIRLPGRNVVCILSGGNIDLPVLAGLLDGRNPKPTASP